jgi:hypothetical protein
MECTQQQVGQIGLSSRIGIVVSQGYLYLGAEWVARKQLEVSQPYHGVLPDDIVPFSYLRPIGVDRHPANKYSRRTLVWPVGQDDVVTGFEFNAIF